MRHYQVSQSVREMRGVGQYIPTIGASQPLGNVGGLVGRVSEKAVGVVDVALALLLEPDFAALGVSCNCVSLVSVANKAAKLSFGRVSLLGSVMCCLVVIFDWLLSVVVVVVEPTLPWLTRELFGASRRRNRWI